jgi:hypothetical protein
MVLPTNKADRLLERQFEEAQKHAARDELEQRIRDHAREVRRFERKRRFNEHTPRPLDLLAIGDSWFNYPLDGDFPVPVSPFDFGITGVRNLKSLGDPPPIILSVGKYQGASTHLLTWENQEQIMRILESTKPRTNGKGPDAILASFGADDIVGDQLAIYLTYGGGTKLASPRFQGVLDLVKASYACLFELRKNAWASEVPIFAHCYDYAIPSGKPAAGLFGPWLKPSFDFALYELTDAQAVVHDMIDKFHRMLSGLASDATNNFHLVDTRGTIAAPNDWSNEIHPNPDGFYRLAQRFLTALQAHFPGRI